LACLAFDELKADRVLNEAFSLYTPEIVCLELILPALAEIGRGWYEGEITVHQEHFASALAMRRLETLLVATPNPTKSGRLIIGCPSGEEHVLSMLLLTLLLRRRGWEVVYLGANIPVFRLAATIAATNPQLVILSAHLLPSVVYLQEIGQLLQKLKVPLAFGGQIFNLRPSLPTRIPGHFLGKRLDEAVARIEGLLTTPPPLPQPEKLSSTYQQALEGYRRYLAQIESDVWQALYDPENLYYQQLSLTLTDQNLARHITAALSLGDMAFIGDNLTWLNSLLNNQNLPIDLLQHYLAVYHHVIQTHLGQTGQPISDWFEQILANQPQHEV
jgi:methanogenic corrinoid protein MtbC1